MTGFGFAFIGTMSKEEMVEELVAHQRATFEKVENIDVLKRMVIRVRTEAVQARLIAEANLEEQEPPRFGWDHTE